MLTAISYILGKVIYNAVLAEKHERLSINFFMQCRAFCNVITLISLLARHHKKKYLRTLADQADHSSLFAYPACVISVCSKSREQAENASVRRRKLIKFKIYGPFNSSLVSLVMFALTTLVNPNNRVTRRYV